MTTETIHVAIYDTWADWEAGFALAHLGSGDWQPDGRRYRIVTVAESLDPVLTKGGISLTPDLTLSDLDPGESAMLILPGADSWLTGSNMEFVEAARGFLGAGVPVAAICGATIPDEGEILIEGQPVHFTSPIDARNMGIEIA